MTRLWPRWLACLSRLRECIDSLTIQRKRNLATNMASKIQERIYAEKARELLGWDCQFNEIPEPVDFEVSNRDGITWGIEIRNVYKSEDETKGSTDKKDESIGSRMLLDLAHDYYAAGGSPIQVEVRGASSLRSHHANMLSVLLGRCPGVPGSLETINVSSDLVMYIDDLPKSWAGYLRWRVIDYYVGGVRSINQAELQNAIDAKATKLAAYKAKYERIDLLLVADRVFGSGRLSLLADVQVNNPGFDNIYFLSYPEAIQRIGGEC